MKNFRITAIPADQRELLLDTTVRGSLTVRAVLAPRRVSEVTVFEDRNSGTSLAVATTPHGTLEHLGNSPYDALQRLATSILR